ncbi:DnaJ-like protein subfamily C member 9 [Nematocida sp. LUAm3]|nr:DnaJ-like protein subfamily C member 9 [Nematocida sp. LUAm3]KAI5175391.1 DnaJ-like protein subfamily C member 9 [Nematocida sp. LUAm2]KAI5177652.1 DnaJ-like protein subfamily C member 9 [Nematocida sp. LUAm1]
MKTHEAAKILGCRVDDSPENIKKRYRKLALLHHPDREGGSEELFTKINAAYEALTTKESLGITKNIFERFKMAYEGSQEEKEEIIGLYTKHKGKLAKIIDHMILGDDEQESRYRSVLDPLIQQKKLPEYAAYKKSVLGDKKRAKKREQEKQLAEVLAKDMETRAEERKERWNSMIERLEEKATKKPKRPKKNK